MATTQTKFMGIKPCGCVVWLYSGEYDTPKQRERALTKAIKDGLRVEPITDEDDARRRWTDCPHSPRIEDPAAEAQRLLFADGRESARG
jgi:hypothetical protein